MKILIKNIKGLVQVREEGEAAVAGAKMKALPVLENAWLAIEGDRIVDYGSMDDWGGITDWRDLEVIDARDRYVFPSWVDSHTHTVFAAPREGEFVDRINGLSYEEIANRGGGILNSARKLQEASEDQLYEDAYRRLDEMMKMGTGAVEIKSGYGLTLEAELKMLRVIKRLQDDHPLMIKSTFLGAHAVPADYPGGKDAYMDHVINDILPKVAEDGLAEYIDIFCEKGYFDLNDTERIMEAGRNYGMKAKIHVNQFNVIGGVGAGVKYDAVSVDHLEELEDADVDVLQGSNTMPVALPSCSFFLSIPYTPARRIIDAGLPLALATDYNPGSTPSGNMNFVVSLACIKMNMNPEEAINAATMNGAAALEWTHELGSITRGKRANLFITKPINSYAFLPYAFGDNVIETVIVNGETVGN